MKRVFAVEVAEIRRLTPRMTRVVFAGEALAESGAEQYTDRYVKIQFPPPEAPYSAPFDLEWVKRELPKELRPRLRAFTVRNWDTQQRRLTIDFVDHGDEGLAGPWLRRLHTGDVVQMQGPGGDYAPSSDASGHLMIGDECVIPSIAAALERVQPGTPVQVLIEVEDPGEEQVLSTPGDLDLRWLHRSQEFAEATPGDRPGTEGHLLEAVESLDLPSTGEPQVFLHGEAMMVRQVRRHLIRERGMSPKSISASGYWKRDRTDEDWRREKSEWKRLIGADSA